MSSSPDDSLLALLGPTALHVLERRADQAGLTRAALAAQILATELVDAEARHGSAGHPRADGVGQLLLPRLVHELRTPVGSLMMLSEMVEAEEGGGADARAAHNARRVRLLASDILHVLEEISELSALQRGTVPLHPQAVSLPGLLAELEQDHRAAAAEVAAELEVHVDPAAPAVVHADRECLYKVLQRLLQGAIRAGAGGKVEVTVSPVDAKGRPGVSFSVVDRGAPLPPGGDQKIFEPFLLADARTRRAHGGSSLGMPIAAAAARALGGELSVRSEPDRTCFTLELPAAPVARGNGCARG